MLPTFGAGHDQRGVAAALVSGSPDGRRAAESAIVAQIGQELRSATRRVTSSRSCARASTPRWRGKVKECALLSSTPRPAPFCGVDDRRDDVLVIGSGPAGASAALMLSTLRRAERHDHKHRWTAKHSACAPDQSTRPRGGSANGIEDQIHHDAAGQSGRRHVVLPRWPRGNRRIHAWGTIPTGKPDYKRASPCLSLDLPQNYLERFWCAMRQHGTHTRFSPNTCRWTRILRSHVLVRDRMTGHRYNIRAKYVIGADGARSQLPPISGYPSRVRWTYTAR